MILPTYSATGKLAPPDSNYDVSRGPFVFPDHWFGIKFNHQHEIVKMILKANEYRHCTLGGIKYEKSQNLKTSFTAERINTCKICVDVNLEGIQVCLKKYFH
ncbi:hypothetical protein PSTG_01611 [Puccinia striiformis f. sp. tritici PST-78]|uniref:Tet-like 2OG-Fe(II) oxygenase domain-containing protein n=1 Tax=Puccinia striiformis f. sp. tritici PST-78 TaxID=1165861 RepID=A0A0L0W1H8_9BASI|nr:hypothetical protein PSTG_01611 [Puccinia striiformis f. sp. tritici PST-78]